jgi:ethanolamine utilization protein EutQ (cupin superfamily)
MSERMQVRHLTAGTEDGWTQVEGDIHVNDLIDQGRDPQAEMTVGYARLGAGEEMEISFPYDEVLVVTRGAYEVRTADGATHVAHAGDVIYLPAESSNHSRALEDTEMAYVAAPPGVYAAHVAAAAVAG